MDPLLGAVTGCILEYDMTLPPLPILILIPDIIYSKANHRLIPDRLIGTLI